jgi:hypothetical protein
MSNFGWQKILNDIINFPKQGFFLHLVHFFDKILLNSQALEHKIYNQQRPV